MELADFSPAGLLFFCGGDDEDRSCADFLREVGRVPFAAIAVWVDGGGFAGGEDFAAEAIDDDGRPCFYVLLSDLYLDGLGKRELVGLKGRYFYADEVGAGFGDFEDSREAATIAPVHEELCAVVDATVLTVGLFYRDDAAEVHGVGGVEVAQVLD